MSVLIDLLLPRRCVICAKTGDDLCDSCREGLTKLRGSRCDRCGAPTAWAVARCKECSGRRLAFAHARAAVSYDDGARLLVAAWKERGLREIAALAAELVCEGVPRPPVYTLTFVPADLDRRLRRGHNPAEKLAQELGDRWELPSPALLERATGIRPQRGLPLAERRRNVKSAFSATERPPTKLALIDDVYTTGATVSAAATALRKAGARQIEVITFARAVR